MKTGCLIILVGIVFGAITCMGADYQTIGRGGPDKFDLKLNESEESESIYVINTGWPDASLFTIPTGYHCEISDYLYTEALSGDIFEFRGQLKFDDYGIRFQNPAKLILADRDDIRCRERQYRGPKICIIPAGYIVDHSGMLSYINGAMIISDADGSSWNYQGTGYLVRVQRVTHKDKFTTYTKDVPDPGKYAVLEWSGPRILKSEIEGVGNSCEDRSTFAMRETSTGGTEPLTGTETWLVERVVNEGLPMADALSGVSTYQFKKDIHQNITFENFIFEGSLDRQIIDMDLEGAIDLDNHRYVINKILTKRTLEGNQMLDHTSNEYLLSNTLYQKDPDLNNGGWTRWSINNPLKMVESLNRRILTGMAETILISKLEFAGTDDELDCYKLEVAPPENVTREVLKEHLGSTGGLPIINATSFLQQGRIVEVEWTMWAAKDSGLPVKSLIKIEYAGSSDGKPGSEIVVNTEEILSLYSYNQPVEIVPPIDALDSPHFPESDGLTTILDVYAPI